MSASLSSINPTDYIYFSTKTTDSCAGKTVKINKHLAVTFIAAVDPKSHEGLTLIRGIEQLTAVANDTNTLTNSNNAAVKMKAFGGIQVCYVVAQVSGDKTTSVYITNLRNTFKGGGQASGFYKVKPIPTYEGSAYQRAKYVKSEGITTDKLVISGAAANLEEAASSGGAALRSMNFDLFYSSGKILNELGAWSLPGSGEIVNTLAKALNAYQGKKIQVHVEGYGAHVLNSALGNVNNLSRFTFKIVNPVTDVARLIHTLDAKQANYTKEIVSLHPGTNGDIDEFNASKVALAFSRLTVVQKILSRDFGTPYAKVVMQLYPKITNLPVNKLEDGINVGHHLTGDRLLINYASSMNVSNFVDLINKVSLK